MVKPSLDGPKAGLPAVQIVTQKLLIWTIALLLVAEGSLPVPNSHHIDRGHLNTSGVGFGFVARLPQRLPTASRGRRVDLSASTELYTGCHCEFEFLLPFGEACASIQVSWVRTARYVCAYSNIPAAQPSPTEIRLK